MNWTPLQINSEVAFHQASHVNACMPPRIAPFFPRNESFNVDPFYKKTTEKASWREERKQDEEFISKFLLSVQSEKSEVKDNSLKIYEAKELLLDVVSLKKKLEKESQSLDVADENFDSKWDLIEGQMNKINENIEKFHSNMNALKLNISKKLRKRKAQRKKKKELTALKEQLRKDIEKKHAVIDKLLNERKDEVDSIKREAALKRQADTVLHEVRRKKYEGTKMLNLLSTLAKLRELRIKDEENRGGYASKQLTDVFNEVIKRFQALWEKQIDIYKLEEKGLKIMLEENAMPHMKESKFETNLLQWEKALFGDVSTDENKKLLTSADDDVEALIQVRRDWDKFIAVQSTPMSSSMPPGWILPPETNDENWKKFTSKR